MSDLKMIKDDPSFISDGDIGSSDAFNHEVFADTIYKIIKDNEPPITIGLFGGWGVGKTSIINLIRKKLKAEDKIAFVYFNAWQYSEDSFRRQFLLTVVSELITDEIDKSNELQRLRRLNYAKTLEESPGASIQELINKGRTSGFWESFSAETKNALENTKLADIGLIRLLFSGSFLLFAFILIAIGWIVKDSEIARWGIATAVISAANFFAPKIENLFVVKKKEVYDAKLIFPEQFKDEYTSLLKKYGKDHHKIIIVIDDLDRCDVDTIKNVLITLKNFLNDEKTVFLVPLDDTAVVRMFKGENHNFGYEQLRKYFSISIRIPEIHNEDLIAYAEQVAIEYDVPADVTFIAALGYCSDARKMKHFLNLYKIKESIALNRKEKGFLGTIEITSITKQLAKLLVLEYQYPEVYKYFSKYPDKIEILTECAYNSEPIKDINFTEINENIKDEECFWVSYPGLKEFLKRTNDINFENFDTISKLKISNQEKDLTKLDIKITSILTSGDKIDLENLDKEVFSKHSSQVLSILKKNYYRQISTIVDRCYHLSIYIIQNNLLDKYYHKNLVTETVRILLEKNRNIKISYSDSLVLLDNWEDMGFWNFKMSEKIEADIFKNEQRLDKFSSLINHKHFTNLLEASPNLSKTIREKTENDFSKCNDVESINNYMSEINNIALESEDRKKYNMIVPSELILTMVIKYIPVAPENFNGETNKIIKSLLFSKKNPLELHIINTFLSFKMEEVFTANIGKPINDILINAMEVIIESPNYMEEVNALVIANLIKLNFAKYNEANVTTKLLVVYGLVISSIEKDKTIRGQHLTSHNNIADSLNYETFLEYIVQLESAYTGLSEYKKGLINRKWIKIETSYNSLDPELLKFASSIEKYNEIIKNDKKEVLIKNMLADKNIAIIALWKDYIIHTVSLCALEKQIDIQNSLLSYFKETGLSEELRNLYFILFIELGEKYNTEHFRDAVSEMIGNLVKGEDSVLRHNVISNIERLFAIFGENIFIRQVNDLINDILNTNNIDEYSSVISLLIKYKNHIRSHVWEMLASKLEADIYNESLSINHKDNLLELCKHITGLSSPQRDKLSETLYYYKESDQDNGLKTKAWEVYKLLIDNDKLNPYTPPPPVENVDLEH